MLLSNLSIQSMNMVLSRTVFHLGHLLLSSGEIHLAHMKLSSSENSIETLGTITSYVSFKQFVTIELRDSLLSNETITASLDQSVSL